MSEISGLDPQIQHLIDNCPYCRCKLDNDSMFDHDATVLTKQNEAIFSMMLSFQHARVVLYKYNHLFFRKEKKKNVRTTQI